MVSLTVALGRLQGCLYQNLLNGIPFRVLKNRNRPLSGVEGEDL
jgi:hypothetical protein